MCSVLSNVSVLPFQICIPSHRTPLDNVFICFSLQKDSTIFVQASSRLTIYFQDRDTSSEVTQFMQILVFVQFLVVFSVFTHTDIGGRPLAAETFPWT